MTALSRLFLAFLIIASIFCSPLVSAQQKTKPQVAFNSFTGIYHLSRDNNNVSLLTTEETILADFPGDGAFYGLVRKIPKTYQGHKVDTKILSVVDAAGNMVPYKITSEKNNLAIATGDPDINLYGSQTIKIRYQTSGVIDLKDKSDVFLLNTNGRGWDAPFNSISATIYIPPSFQARLTTDPICYTTVNSSRAGCQINTQKNPDSIVITAKTTRVPAHQSMVVKLNFAPSTFSNQSQSAKTVLLIGAGILLASIISLYLYIGRKK